MSKQDDFQDYVEKLQIIGQTCGKNKDTDIIQKLMSDQNWANLLDGKMFDKLIEEDMTVAKLLDWYELKEQTLDIKSKNEAAGTCLVGQIQSNSKERKSSSTSNNSRSSNGSRNAREPFTRINKQMKTCWYCGYQFPHLTENVQLQIKHVQNVKEKDISHQFAQATKAKLIN